MDVVRDADMTTAEKRSVLASWASDGARSSRTRVAGCHNRQSRQL
jgi:hypothetical protein